MKIWQIDFAIVIHIHTDFDMHICCWFDIAHGCIIWMSVHQPYADWNIITRTYETNTYETILDLSYIYVQYLY